MGENRLPETKEQAVPFRHLPLSSLSTWPKVAVRRLHARTRYQKSEIVNVYALIDALILDRGMSWLVA